MVSELLTTPPEHEAPILVVDDHEALRNLLLAGLDQFGYRAEPASGYESARELLRSRGYSMVISDYEMPDGSGLQLLDYVSRVRPDVPFILLTGYDNIPLARRAIESGALDFLTKPVDIRQLIRLIEQNRSRLARDRDRAASLTNEILNGTVRALVAAIDAKDPHTASHSERVARLALRLGQEAGLTADRLRVLEFAALMHDVGKIGIPEGILLKAGRLDENEWALIKQHPVRSAEIVSQVSCLAEVATIVRHHHERVDGTGYPDGLSGDAIPPLSRLVTVADAFEAMTSARSYRGKMDAGHARDVIRAGSGTHFDTQYVDILMDLGEAGCT